MTPTLPTDKADENTFLFESLVSQLEDFVVVLTNEEGFFTSWHPGVERVFGFRADEFIGRHFDILFPPAERLAGTTTRELQTARETGKASDTGWLIRKDGAPIFVEGVTLGLRLAEGQFAGFGKILRDVTDRQKSEETLSTLSSALDQSAVIVRSWDGVIRHWTAGSEHLYGWTSKEAIGQVCQEFLRTRFTTTPLNDIHHQLATAGSWKGELEHRHRNGTVLSVSGFWMLMRGASDDLDLVIETQTDITDRTKMREELERAHEELKRIRDELERSNEELEEFARIASHDLSAPITSTRWLIDIFRKRHMANLEPEAQQCIEHIGRSLARMADLVEGVLAHARAGSEPVADTLRSDAGEAFSIALENLQSDIDRSGASISHEVFPEVAAAPQALSQLFQNLLSNAMKYRRPSVRPVIEVSVIRQETMWLFSIRDNGVGIQPEWFERIFQPMQRLAGMEVPGSGIGLATCRKIVRRAGGSIWVESEVGVGSTFLFTLPRTQAPLEKN